MTKSIKKIKYKITVKNRPVYSYGGAIGHYFYWWEFQYANGFLIAQSNFFEQYSKCKVSIVNFLSITHLKEGIDFKIDW